MGGSRACVDIRLFLLNTWVGWLGPCSGWEVFIFLVLVWVGELGHQLLVSPPSWSLPRHSCVVGVRDQTGSALEMVSHCARPFFGPGFRIFGTTPSL